MSADGQDPVLAPIVAAHRWANNAAMIETARDLGYVKGRVLDPTYGRGTWWKKWRPAEIVMHDLKLDGVDFRKLPDDGLFDTITFDPPYIPQGGRETSTLGEAGSSGHFLDRYGLVDVPSTNEGLKAALGYVQVDELIHLRHPGPQPARKEQRTARRNYSQLIVLRWPSAPLARDLFEAAAS
jgi:hypothetical protein